MMICCLNPECHQPLNHDSNKFCQACSTPLVPLLINRFWVLRVLSNEGGFGKTYLAEDTHKLNETCVINQLVPKQQGSWAFKKAIELFEEEAKRLQDLGEHSQIPTVFAYFEENNFLYLVQQFIAGENLLNELAQSGKYNESQIRALLLDLLPPLKFLHERNVIHRDIKPQNIMRRKSDGRLVLIDFGASKQLTVTVHTQIGTQIGSHGYSPLEQIKGGEAYPASDLFALGATCFHLLTGIHPFNLWAVNGYAWVNDWRQHLPISVSGELGEVLDKLLKIDIHERYQSADEVINDLSPKPKQVSVPPTPPQLAVQPPVKPIEPKKTGKLRNRLLLGAGVLLLGLISIEIYSYTRYGFFADPIFLIDSFPSSFFLEKTFQGHSEWVDSVAISADGKTLASGSLDKTIKLWNLATAEEIRTLKGHSGLVRSVAFSADGKTLVSGSSDKTIKLWNLATAEEIRTLKGHSDSVRSVAISADGKTLASGSSDNTIKLWNLATAEEIRTLKGHSSSVYSVAISADGKTLVSGSWDNTIKLWNLATAEEIRTLKGHSDWVYSVDISADGKTLASGSYDKTIKLWNLATAEEIRTLKGHSSSVYSVAFSADGKTLVSGSSDNTIKLWNLATAEEIRTLKGHSSSVYSVAISADGKTLVSGSDDKTIKIWRVAP